VNERGKLLRTVVAREPYFFEPLGTRYIVIGVGYVSTTHDSLPIAQAAAVESVPAAARTVTRERNRLISQ
jgi:hypothetical protein